MKDKPYILIANGVNLDLLGKREIQYYGEYSLQDIEQNLLNKKDSFAKMCGFINGCDINFFQTNDEAKFLELISQKCDGIVLNAGAWSHTSLALADRLAALQTPFVEIHITNLAKREPYRHISYISSLALGIIYGLGFHSYEIGLIALLTKLATLK